MASCEKVPAGTFTWECLGCGETTFGSIVLGTPWHEQLGCSKQEQESETEEDD